MQQRLLGLLVTVVVLTASPVGAAQAPVDPAQLEGVAAVLRTPLQRPGTSVAEQHARDLRLLGFDPLPAAAALLHDNRIGTEAARAMIVLDERKALTMIFGAVPRAALSTQLVVFVWFLDHEATLGGLVNKDAYDAAMRVLIRIESTAMAELALYTIGMVGSEADFPLLEEFATTRASGTMGLQSASQAALSRLGSRPHLDSIRTQLTEPLPERPSYLQGVRVATLLRQAAFSANAMLAPAVCTHLSDPPIGDFELRIEPASIAANSLNKILDPVSPERPSAVSRRSVDEWKAYCQRL